ncbi:MAG: hypothetical protein EXS08_08830 [Planctomycetes bacterium]|nr:hypothetical protein [Planctomycetota bacterium]
MESAQKRERDRKNRQKRQDKEDRRKDRAQQKVERLANPGAAPHPSVQDIEGQEVVIFPVTGQG